MSKTVKIALELNLENAEQLALYLAIGAALGNGVKAPVEQLKPSKDPEQVSEEVKPVEKVKPMIKMQDILSKVTTLIMTSEAKDKNEPAIKQWMQSKGHIGKVASMPEHLWTDFYTFINEL